MTAQVESLPTVAGLPWTVFRGDRESVFLALGREHAELIASVRSRVDQQWQSLMSRIDDPQWAERLSRIIDSTTRQLPIEAQELAWIAAGAGQHELDLWVYNLRGDLGRDGTGCSDVCTANEGHVVLGHNEDGDAHLRDDVRLITLDIDGDPSCTVIWYPGMLPANSFVATSAGLVFGLDHVPVTTPAVTGCGRHFVARHAQRQSDGEAARRVVRETPCAGGFSFDIADALAGRADVIENAAGRVSEVSAASAAVCHTNHLRLVDGTQAGLSVADDDEWLAESRARRRALSSAVESAETSSGTVDAAGVLAALRAPGVLNRRDDLYTLATAVADLTGDRITVQASTKEWTGRLSAFVRGEQEEI